VDPRRDHSFRVPRPDLSVELGVPNACATCHVDRSDAWSASAVRAWLGRDAKGFQNFAQAFAAGRAGRIDAGGALRQIAADRGQPAIVRATALELLRGYPGLETLEVATAAIRDSDPSVRLAALVPLGASPVEDRVALFREAWTDPVRGVRIEAARMMAGVDPALLGPIGFRQLIEALSEYVDAQQASLDRPAARLNLGNLYAEAGDPALAEEQYLAALALDPGFEPAFANLADLLSRQGFEAASGEILAEGVAALPNSATLYHAIGLHQIRSGHRTAALESLGKAAELAPQNPRFSYVYAIALDSEGRRDEAIARLEGTHAIREVDQDVLSALVSLSLESGNFDAARAHARQLQRLRPGDARLEALLQQLGDR